MFLALLRYRFMTINHPTKPLVKVKLMKLRGILLAAILLVVFTAACVGEPQVLDDNLLKDISLLTADPCAAPCWQDIVPGETEWEEAVSLIEGKERFKNIQSLDDDQSDAQALTWQDGDDSPTCCQMFSRGGDVVDTIFLLLAPQMALGEVLEEIGDPLYVTGEEVTGDQALISLVYPDIPLVLYVFVAGSAEGELTASSEVVGAIYMTEADMEGVLENTNLYDWQGYQAYGDYITGDFDRTAVPTGQAEATEESDSE